MLGRTGQAWRAVQQFLFKIVKGASGAWLGACMNAHLGLGVQSTVQVLQARQQALVNLCSSQ